MTDYEVEIIKLAREAGFSEWSVQTPQDLIRFAKLVAQAEREACARICEELEVHREDRTWYTHAIRARGQE